MADQEDPPGQHFPPIAPDDPEWFLYFTDPANGICHTVSCSEFTTAFGANITHHRRSLGHIIAACVDENLQKLNIAGTITYAELERKQSIHRSLTCHVCPELYGGGVTVEPTAYAAHITSHEHMILEQETDGYESIGLLSWQKCREPYCPGYGMGIPPWRLARHLHCDVHRNAGRMFSVLAETGMSPGQLAARAAALRKGICDIRGCLGYGAANRSREPADLLDHLESHWHRHAQRVRLGLPLESESDPERHYCRLMGCRGHAGNGGNVFRSRSSYSRHLNGHRHQEAVQGIKERVMAALRHMAFANTPTQQINMIRLNTPMYTPPAPNSFAAQNQTVAPNPFTAQAQTAAPDPVVPQVNTTAPVAESHHDDPDQTEDEGT